MHYHVELSPAALVQAEAAMTWWEANRPQAADLFLVELDATIQRLTTMLRSGGDSGSFEDVVRDFRVQNPESFVRQATRELEAFLK